MKFRESCVCRYVMKDEKHIDKLFKDRFKSFEVSPSPEVWGSIQASLEKRKKDRKIIPLWVKLGGVAALLALLFTIGNTVFNAPDVDSEIVTTEKTNNTDKSIKDESPLLKDKELVDNSVISEETKDSENQKDTPSIIDKNSKSKDAFINKSKKSKTAVAVDTKTSEKINTESKDIIKDVEKIVDTKKDVIAMTSEKKPKSEKVNPKLETPDTNLNNTIIKDKDIAKTDIAVVAKTDTETVKTEAAKKEAFEETETNKTSILDAIKEQEAIKTEEAVVTKNDKLDRRWDVAPNFAPVYYNTLSSGSSLDPSFSDNSQTGDVNFSYGVQVSYAVSNRLSVRSGVSNVDLSYSTGGIELGTGPVSTALKSVNYGGKQTVLTAVDVGTIASQNNSNGGFGDIQPKATNGAAEIVQSISYYEIPLELKYSLLNRKVGVNIIGGLSTLFLGSNEVSVSAGDFQSTLGEANNLSSVSFTTNVGLGFDYKFSKKFRFNIEPMFKYQLNPYTDSSVNFRPYYLGVYTGFSYRF